MPLLRDCDLLKDCPSVAELVREYCAHDEIYEYAQGHLPVAALRTSVRDRTMLSLVQAGFRSAKRVHATDCGVDPAGFSIEEDHIDADLLSPREKSVFSRIIGTTVGTPTPELSYWKVCTLVQPVSRTSKQAQVPPELRHAALVEFCFHSSDDLTLIVNRRLAL